MSTRFDGQFYGGFSRFSLPHPVRHCCPDPGFAFGGEKGSFSVLIYIMQSLWVPSTLEGRFVFFAASIGSNSLLILGSADRCVYCHGLRQLTHYGSIFIAHQLTELGEKVTQVVGV